MIHIGREIEKTLHSQGRTVTWLAKQLGCTRMSVYKMFDRESVGTMTLWKISRLLGRDFFIEYSKALIIKSEGKKKVVDTEPLE
jgi:hypothetical protein